MKNQHPPLIAGQNNEPGAQTGLAWRLMLKEPSSQARYADYSQVSITIGRSPQSDLQLQDRFASGSHARLTFTAAGLFLLTDLNSANGTYVNGQTVTEVYVRAGDQVMIGKTVITICGDEVASATTHNSHTNSNDDEVTAVLPRGQASDGLGGILTGSLVQGISRVSRLINRDKLQNGSVQQLLEQLLSLFDADCGFIVLKDLEQQRWSIAAQAGSETISAAHLQPNADPNSRELPSLSVARTVIEGGQTFFSADLSAEVDFNAQTSIQLQSINSILCVPLTVNKKNTHGALYLDRRGLAAITKNPWTIQHKELAESLVRLMSTMFANARLQEELTQEIRTRTNLQRYVSPQIVEQVMSEKHQLTLGGREIQASVLFTDIRGFTKMSSSMNPTQLIGQLNEYFSLMAKVIFTHGGYLDKFIGDAIMAVFGVPEPRPDDAKRALLAAIEMHRRLQLLNEEWRKRQLQPFEMGIGVNSGRVIVGNIGSTQRMEYTVLGDTVNVASRLCSVAEPKMIIAAASTVVGLENQFQLKPADLPELKGKAQGSVQAFEVTQKG